MPYPKSYSLVSRQQILDDSLFNAVAALPDPGLQGQYLQLPDSIPSRVKELALSITESSFNDYSKAFAIQDFLKKTFPYTNEPDLSKKKSSDFVYSFLFEVQEGYCDYFSTAMAVLAREVGLPARWVKGYAPGFNRGALEGARRGVINSSPVEDDIYEVRNADAHSWVEIYFSGYGWIPFEATAGFDFPYMTSADDTGAETASRCQARLRLPLRYRSRLKPSPSRSRVISTFWGSRCWGSLSRS